MSDQKRSTKWRPGQSGNPKGRPPKGEAFADVMREVLAEPYQGRTKKEALVRVAVDMALKKDLDALKWLVDRVDGKVADKLAVQNGDDPFRVQVTYRDESTDADG